MQNTTRQKPRRQNQNVQPTGLNAYQAPDFDHEEYGALKQRVKTIEETLKNHSTSINTIENQRSWIKGAAWGIGGLLIVLIGFLGWFIATFKDNMTVAFSEAIKQLISK